MHPLTLQVQLGAWRLYAIRKADPAFHAFRDKIWHRDNYTCQFCGFQAREYQDVVNLDHNYRNNKASNLATACCFCAQCFFLESVGLGDYGGGSLIYLPELTQSQLNSLCHVLFCAISNDTAYKDSSQSIYRALKLRSQVIDEKFGEGSSNPTVFGQMIIDTNIQGTDACNSLLADLRLLPSRSKFKTQIDYWASSALNELSSELSA